MGLTRHAMELASSQGGILTRAQLHELGYSPGSVDWMVRSGTISVVSSGAYRAMPASDEIELVRGAVVALPNAVASHQSAAHLLRFPKLPRLEPTVVVASHTTHRFPGVTVRRCDDLIDADIVRVDGLATTNAPRTLFDLSGILKFRMFDAIGESLVIAGRMELDQYQRITDRLARRGKPGSRASRDFLEMRMGHHSRATVLERKGRGILVAAGLPRPIPEYPIPWDPRRRFDDAFPDFTTGIEWDSRAWHVQLAAMAADRQRDREAASHEWALLRFTWDEVTKQPQMVVETVRTVLRQRGADV